MRRLVALMMVMVMAMTACSGTTPTPEPFTPTTLAPSTTISDNPDDFAEGTQLVTEAQLLFEVANNVAEDIAVALTGLIADHIDAQVCEHAFDDQNAKDWHDNNRLTVRVSVAGGCGDDDGRIYVHIGFGNSIYVDGEVTTADCRKLPGAGTVGTGEYDVLENDTDEDDTRHIEHTTTESHSVENSLDEDVELTSGTDVEAGTSFPGGDAKVTQHFESHLGIHHGSVASNEKTTERTIADDITVKAHTAQAASFVVDDTTTECHLNINSTVDYQSLDIKMFRSDCNVNEDFKPCQGGYNLGTIENRGIVHYSHDWFYWQDLNNVDDIVRLVKGHDPRCDGCEWRLAPDGDIDDAVNRLDSGERRKVHFDGTRRTTTKDSASVKLIDVTALDRDCVGDVLGKEGTAVGDYESQLEACKS